MRFLLALSAVLLPALAFGQVRPTTVHVDAADVVHTLRGGIGASWHAMLHDVPLDNERYDYPVRSVNPRGSAFGGNPPVARRDVWDQIERHAAWLGLDWLRVELSQRMYEPRRDSFDWDNEEMQALYRILDWAERHGADVFLQQQLTAVDWNAYPGVHPMLSAPRSIPAFAHGIATLLDHLVRRRGYRSIRWFCITNEPPGGTWGYWWSTGSYPSITITPALRAVRDSLDRRGLDVPLSGPDWTDLPPLDLAAIDFDDAIGAYDLHSYGGMPPARAALLAEWVALAHARGKPFFLSEMGDMRLGWGKDHPGPASFAAALSNAETIVRGLRLGVDGFSRWSFTNRGDLDGQWQLVRTWDRARRTWLDTVAPEPAAYYGYALLTRFLPKHASRLADRVEGPPEVLTVSLRSPAGPLTTILLNLAERPAPVEVTYAGLVGRPTARRYRLTDGMADVPGFSLTPEATLPLRNGAPVSDVLPARSLTVLTTYALPPDAPGAIRD